MAKIPFSRSLHNFAYDVDSKGLEPNCCRNIHLRMCVGIYTSLGFYDAVHLVQGFKMLSQVLSHMLSYMLWTRPISIEIQWDLQYGVGVVQVIGPRVNSYMYTCTHVHIIYTVTLLIFPHTAVGTNPRAETWRMSFVKVYLRPRGHNCTVGTGSVIT